MMNSITHRIRVGLVLIAIVAPGWAAGARGQETDPRREPAGAIKEAIRLLERSDYVAFVKQCMRPSEMEEMVAKLETVENVAKEFAKTDRPAKLLEILKAASTLTPTIRPDGLRADYTFDNPVAGAKRLSLAKIGELWFLRD